MYDGSSSLKSPKTDGPVEGFIKVLLSSVVIFLASQFVAALVASVILIATGTSPENVEELFTDSTTLQFLLLVFVEVAAFLGVALALKFSGRDIKILNWELPKPIQLLKIAGYFLAYLAINYLAVIFIDLFIPAIDVEQVQQVGFEAAKGSQLLLVFIGLCVAVPVGEEVLFRGLLYRGSKKYIGLWPAATVTTILFGLAHLEFIGGSPLNWIAAVDTALFSLALIYTYEKQKTIWSPIILHSLKNSLAFLFVFILDK